MNLIKGIETDAQLGSRCFQWILMIFAHFSFLHRAFLVIYKPGFIPHNFQNQAMGINCVEIFSLSYSCSVIPVC